MRRIAQQESVEVTITDWPTMQAEAIRKVAERLDFTPVRYVVSFCGPPARGATTALLTVQAFSY